MNPPLGYRECHSVATVTFPDGSAARERKAWRPVQTFGAGGGDGRSSHSPTSAGAPPKGAALPVRLADGYDGPLLLTHREPAGPASSPASTPRGGRPMSLRLTKR